MVEPFPGRGVPGKFPTGETMNPREPLDERVSDWLEGRLSPEEAKALEEDLARQGRLEEARELARVVRLLGKAPSESPPPGLPDHVLDRITGLSREPAPALSGGRKALPWVLSLSAAAAAALLVYITLPGRGALPPKGSSVRVARVEGEAAAPGRAREAPSPSLEGLPKAADAIPPPARVLKKEPLHLFSGEAERGRKKEGAPKAKAGAGAARDFEKGLAKEARKKGLGGPSPTLDEDRGFLGGKKSQARRGGAPEKKKESREEKGLGGGLAKYSPREAGRPRARSRGARKGAASGRPLPNPPGAPAKKNGPSSRPGEKPAAPGKKAPGEDARLKELLRRLKKDKAGLRSGKKRLAYGEGGRGGLPKPKAPAPPPPPPPSPPSAAAPPSLPPAETPRARNSAPSRGAVRGKAQGRERAQKRRRALGGSARAALKVPLQRILVLAGKSMAGFGLEEFRKKGGRVASRPYVLPARGAGGAVPPGGKGWILTLSGPKALVEETVKKAAARALKVSTLLLPLPPPPVAGKGRLSVQVLVVLERAVEKDR